LAGGFGAVVVVVEDRVVVVRGGGLAVRRVGALVPVVAGGGGAVVVVAGGAVVVVVVGQGTVVVVVVVVGAGGAEHPAGTVVVVVVVPAASAGLADARIRAAVTPVALITAAARRGERDITRQPSAIRPGRRRTCLRRQREYQWSDGPGVAAGERWLNVQTALRLFGARPAA
jgi:hypothetical protein